jgi:hypothetical protein
MLGGLGGVERDEKKIQTQSEKGLIDQEEQDTERWMEKVSDGQKKEFFALHY